MANFTANELKLISVLRELTEKEGEFLFKPDKDWMIVNKSGFVPEEVLNPSRILLGKSFSIRPEIKGLPVVILIHEKGMSLFEGIDDISGNLLKVHNYNKPAIQLSFFQEHRYNFRIIDKEDAVKNISLAIGHSNISDLERRELQFTLDELKSQKDSLRFFTTNYNLGYSYKSVSFKYENQRSGNIISTQKHVAKDKVNVIFLTNELISGKRIKKARYKSKTIDLLVNHSDMLLDGHTTQFFSCKPEIFEQYEQHDR